MFKRMDAIKVVSILLFGGLFLGSFVYSEESKVDPDKSTFNFISRAGEESKTPVFGETLNGRITFKDKDGNPIGGIDGKDVQIISIEEGETVVKSLAGKSQAGTGYLNATFIPKNPKSGKKIKFAIKAEGVVLSQVREFSFHPASELVDQCQPLWSGAQHLFASRTVGQTFVTGNINKISRIKVMAKKYGSITIPILKLYLWDTDYKTTTSKEPIVVSKNPKTYENPHWRRNMHGYKLNFLVKPNTKYYFELNIPDKSGNKENFFTVWRAFHHSGGSNPHNPDSYPKGVCYWGGGEQPKMDLMFYVFFSASEASL